MVDTIIVSGGNIQSGFALDFLKKYIDKEKKPELIAADKGLEFFIEAEILPDIAVGDFDSLSPEGNAWLLQAKNLGIRRLKPEKDDSDTQSAVNLAIQRGAKNILLLGCTGTRLDHVMANFGLLSHCRKKGVHVTLVDENNWITLVESGTILKQAEQFGKYVSFFSLGCEVKGLTLEGFKYPLKNHHLKASDSGLTVSNEIQEETARVTFEEGELLMFMTRD